MTHDTLMALVSAYVSEYPNDTCGATEKAALSTALQELVAERDEADRALVLSGKVCKAQFDAIDTLMAERDEHKENAFRNARIALVFRADRDALALDAARYRWLFADMATSGDLDRAERALACFEYAETCTKDELDAAIDSAMKGTP